MTKKDNSCLYLYAIIPAEVDIVFDVDAMDEENDVYTIPFVGVSAVVSSNDKTDFRKLKRADATQYLVTHQRVIEVVMQDYPLLPVRFGTILGGTKQVLDLLEQKQLLFKDMLEKFKDKIQLEVAVLWDVQPVFQAIAQTESVRQLKAQIDANQKAGLTNQSGDAMLSKQVELGKLVKTILENYRLSLQNIILPILRQTAIDIVINPLMDDIMVLNAALLVDGPGRLALEKNLDELDAAFERNKSQLPGETKLIFRCVGPLPLYSYANVDIQSISFEIVDKARRVLGLAETATSNEIKTAYHKKAAQIHPDHQPDLSDAEQQMTELTEAYQLLTTYCNKSTEPSKFTKDNIENTLLVNVKRQPDFVTSIATPVT